MDKDRIAGAARLIHDNETGGCGEGRMRRAWREPRQRDLTA